MFVVVTKEKPNRVKTIYNMIDNADDGTNFLHNLSLTERQVHSICKSFENNYAIRCNCQRC